MLYLGQQTNRKGMFIMKRNYHLMTIVTLNLEGDYML